MAWASSMRVRILAWAMKSAEEYLEPVSFRSRMTWTSTPRARASTSALAIGAEVREYAWTSTVALAAARASTTACVAPWFGEKYTRHGGSSGAARGAGINARATTTTMAPNGRP